MFKKYFPLLLVPVLFASCFKYINIDNSLKYTITGFQNITIDQNDSNTLYVSVQLLSGDPTNEYVHCAVSGLPDSVSINLDSITFRPNYYFRLVFYAHYPKPGVYPITITTTSPSEGTKVYTFNLTVTSLIDCTQLFSAMTGNNTDVIIDGNTNSSNIYAYFSRTACDTLSIEVIKDSIELIGSDPIMYPLYQFSVSVNCAANTLTIFPQSAKFLPANEMITGAGIFAPGALGNCTITLNDTVYSGTQIINTGTFTIY